MKSLLGLVAVVAMTAGAASAAEEGPPATPPAAAVDTGAIPVTGSVPPLCSFGAVSTTVGSFDVGVLIDTTTGLLRTDLSAPNKTINGSWCNARSTLNVSGVLMTAQNFTATPPTGFSRGVNFVATASGWTPTAASFDTSVTGAQAPATQTQVQPNATTITLAVGTFATDGGTTLRPVADTSYQGSVTLTLTPTP